jgi:hypothetical protein
VCESLILAARGGIRAWGAWLPLLCFDPTAHASAPEEKHWAANKRIEHYAGSTVLHRRGLCAAFAIHLTYLPSTRYGVSGSGGRQGRDVGPCRLDGGQGGQGPRVRGGPAVGRGRNGRASAPASSGGRVPGRP